MTPQKIYFIQNVLDNCILKRNEYNTFSLGYVPTLIGEDIKYFNTHKEAEEYILSSGLIQVKIVETYI